MLKIHGSIVYRSPGFTLVELMIAIVIVGILATVAYPSYQDSVRQGRRIDATSTLLALQLEIEKRRTNNTSYANSLPVANAAATYDSRDGIYDITYSNLAVATFTVTATPKAGTDQASDTCGAYIINENGPDTSTAAKRACWGM